MKGWSHPRHDLNMFLRTNAVLMSHDWGPNHLIANMIRCSVNWHETLDSLGFDLFPLSVSVICTTMPLLVQYYMYAVLEFSPCLQSFMTCCSLFITLRVNMTHASKLCSKPKHISCLLWQDRPLPQKFQNT